MDDPYGHLGSVVAISITRMAMYIHVGTTFLEHYNDETCKITTISFPRFKGIVT